MVGNGRRRRLNEQDWLLNKIDRLRRIVVRGARVVGLVCVAESVGRNGTASTETAATPREARPAPAAMLGAGILRRTQNKQRKQTEQDRPSHGQPS
jgi:hypothetical protein